MTQTTILHFSDLHICTEDLIPKLEELAKAAESEFQQKFDIEFASPESLETLEEEVRDLDPDVICITGDITTFGDKASFLLAEKFIKNIKNRGKKNRTIIVTPGNHDILCSQLKAITTRFKTNYLFQIGSIFFPKKAAVFKLINKILSNSDIGVNVDDPLVNFRKFCDSAGCSNSEIEIKTDNGDPIWIVPYESVSLDPLWINIGAVSENEFNRFRGNLRNHDTQNGTLIALLHHNPLSSPDVIEPKIVNAYNSMPGGSAFVKEMQDVGVDIILYGHQHKNACCLIDYQPCTKGHVYLIASTSSTCGENRGYNLITVKNKYHAISESFNISAMGGKTTQSSRDLILESEQVSDFITLSASKELRYYRYNEDGDAKKWNEMYNPDVKELFLAGPRIRSLQDEFRRKTIVDFLSKQPDSKIRILISDPELFNLIEGLESSARERLSEMWGDTYNWEVQSQDVRNSIRSLISLEKELEKASIHPSRFSWQLAHTLMPIGVIARDLHEDFGSMMIRMLPVGVMGAIDRPTKRLENRHDRATYRYYEEYLEGLWSKSRLPNENDRRL